MRESRFLILPCEFTPPWSHIFCPSLYRQTDETAKKEKRKKSEVDAAETGDKEAKVKVAVKNLTMGVGAGEVSQ